MIGICSYPGHAYCRDEFIDNTEILAGKHDVCLLWNGKGERLADIFPSRWLKDWYSPKPNERGIDILKNKQNVIRKKFLKGDYTHLFLLESDVMPPLGTIEKLLSADKDIIAGLYFIESMQQTHYVLPDKQFVRDRSEVNPGEVCHIFKGSPIPSVWGLWGKHSRLWELNDALPQRGPVRVLSAHLGATLIKREVLEGTKFRIKAKTADTQQFTDFMFHWDAYQDDREAFVDTDIWCKHVHQEDDLAGFSKWFDAGDLKGVDHWTKEPPS